MYALIAIAVCFVGFLIADIFDQVNRQTDKSLPYMARLYLLARMGIFDSDFIAIVIGLIAIATILTIGG